MISRQFALVSTFLALSVALASCGGSDSSVPLIGVTPTESSPPNGTAPPDPTVPVDTAAACQELGRTAVASAEIALPTRGAIVLSSALQTASAAPLRPEYCKVLLQIASVDTSAPPINVQVNLPTNWNKKAVHFGGGGFDGFLVTGEDNVPGTYTAPTPLSSGYATFGSDGGHSDNDPSSTEAGVQSFLNDEVIANYAGDQLKKTRDIAISIIKKRYGTSPAKTYFVGQSGGGREALIVTQRFGTDYDGVISYFPAAGGVPLLLNFGRVTRALASPGAYPNVAKQRLLHSAVTTTCDGADGAIDGIISNPQACTFNVASIRCSSGGDEGDGCLSDAQIAALDVMSKDLEIPYSLASGEKSDSGYNVYKGVDLTALASGLGTAPPSSKPILTIQPGHNFFSDIFYRGILTRDPGANSLSFDPYSPGVYQARLSYLSTRFYTGNPDLSTFKEHGGKLIVIHGKDDSLIPVGSSSAYYTSVVSKMGIENVDNFMRYFEVPGFGHGGGSFVVNWDSLSALDSWVENGTSVDNPIVSDVNPATMGRTRPLCKFPSWPKYYNAGDINSASSYTCVAAQM